MLMSKRHLWLLVILTARETASDREPHNRLAATAWSTASVQSPGPRRGTMAAGSVSVNWPATFAVASRTVTATLVVVESTERGGAASVVVVPVTCAAFVVVGELDVPPSLVVDCCRSTRGAIVVVTAVGVVELVVDVVLDAVPGAREPAGCEVVGVGESTGCRGRELSVKTSTNNSRGLDHISSWELRSVIRRDAMVIEE